MMNWNAIRRILTSLLIIPLGMIAYVYLFPDWQLEHPNLEFPFLLIGVPIVVLNFFLWFRPEFFQPYFHVDENLERVTDEKFVALLHLAGVFTALIFVGVGAVSVMSGVGAHPILGTPATQVVEVADFPVFDGAPTTRLLPTELPATELPSTGLVSTAFPSLTAESSETGVVATPTQSTAIVQIPISGGNSTSTPAPSRTPTNGVSSTAKPTNTPINGVSPTVKPSNTNTPSPSGSCTLASSDFLEAIREIIVDVGQNYTVQTGWAVQSNEAEDLWFVAAKIHGDDIETGVSLPGVWALFTYSDGYIDIYAINDTAQEYSFTLWGEDSDPVLSMDSNGAQSAYNCDLNGN